MTTDTDTLTPSQRGLLDVITCPEELSRVLIDLANKLLDVKRRALGPLVEPITWALMAEVDHYERASAKLTEMCVNQAQRAALLDGMLETSPGRLLKDLLFDITRIAEDVLDASEHVSVRLRREAMPELPGAVYDDHDRFIGIDPVIAARTIGLAIDAKAADGAHR